MIFDSIKYGTFTADDFINAHANNDFSKFTLLPVDLKKQFISDVIDETNKEYPNKQSKNFKQAAFDFIDKKIDEKQFRDIWWKYWGAASDVISNGARSMRYSTAPVAVVVSVAAVAVVTMAGVLVDYYPPHFKKYASLLNKLIQEYE